MNRFLLVFSLLTLGSFSLKAQSVITGLVNDNDGNPLMGATVLILKTNLGAITNTNGAYELKTTKGSKVTVQASMLGYKTETKTIILKNAPYTLNFTLNESSVEHGEVLVTGKSEAQEMREVPQAITVIDTKEIEGRVVTVSSLLNKAVGIKIRKSGGEGSATRVSVRGLEGKRIGFFIDGFPMSENSDYMDIDDIPVSFIKRIEVYKGVVPAKFGGSAIGGAVNLILKEYPPTYIEAGYSRESFGINKASAIIKKNNTESGYEIGAGGFYTNAGNTYDMLVPDQNITVTRDHDVFEKFVLGGSFSSKVWWFDEVVFEPVYINSSQQIQGIDRNYKHVNFSFNAFAIANNIESAHFLYKDLELQFTQIYGYSVSNYVDTASVITHWNGSTAPSSYGEVNNQMRNDSDNKKHTYLNRLNLNYPFTENHSLNFNSVFRFADFSPYDAEKDSSMTYKTNYDSKSNSFVAGLTHEFKSGNDIFINAFSLKYYTYSINTTLVESKGSHSLEKIDISQSDFGLNNAMRYRLTPTFLLKNSFAYDLRLPSEDELLGDGYAVAPAGNLKPERNISLNIGALYDAAFSRDTRLQVEFNVFYYEIKDMIRLVTGINQSNYENFDKMRAVGADFEIKYDMNRYIFLYTNATYQDLRDTREFSAGTTNPNPTEDHRMPNIPFFFANAGFEFHKENLFGGSEQNSRLYLDASFIEEFYYDWELTKQEKRRIPQTLSFDVGFEHSMYNDSFVVTAQINNLTDETLISEYDRPLPGRSFGVKFRYIFK